MTTRTTRAPGRNSDTGGSPLPLDLDAYIAAGAITAADIAAAATLVRLASSKDRPLIPDILAWVAMCLALRTPRDGHTCVDLARIEEWAGDIDLSKPDHLLWPTGVEAWKAALTSASLLVGTHENDRTPFVLDGNRLYLARALFEEREIKRCLLHIASAPFQNESERVIVLMGGPGTGKTTTVARQLIERFQSSTDVRIALAAPTGKAAARMAEALSRCCQAEHAPEAVFKAIELARPTTVHRLLGSHPRRVPRYKFGPDNPLSYDLVVVDEASMLSSSLTYRLLAALSDSTRLLLVGDPNQLASVDAGSVLADIAAAAIEGTPLHGRSEKLTKRYRFGEQIGELADAILAGDATKTIEVLGRGTAEVRWIRPDKQGLATVTAEVVAHGRKLVDLASKHNAASDADKMALDKQRELQVLCAHRLGSTGVAGWNARVERELGVLGGSTWYAGRPVMVTRNSPSLCLFNGDAGLVMNAGGERMQAVFDQGEHVPVTRLEDVTTVHALTIHKSQGSEYGHAIVVLPDVKSRLLTRELFYTGVTRAVKHVTVVGSADVIRFAVERQIRRASGLAEQLR